MNKLEEWKKGAEADIQLNEDTIGAFRFETMTAKRLLAVIEALEKCRKQRNFYAGEDPIYFQNPNFTPQEKIDDEEIEDVLSKTD